MTGEIRSSSAATERCASDICRGGTGASDTASNSIGRPGSRRIAPDRVDAVLRPWSLLPALMAVAATMAAAPAQAEQPAPAAVERPLAVSIDTLTPSYLPARGPVRLTGSVTNNTDDRWVAINTHVFISDTPITSAEELEEQAALDPEEPVGERITVPGTFDTIDSLEPGESSQFSIEISRARLGVEAPGVYWFGVHALGESGELRDGMADGRARTFVPAGPSAHPGQRRHRAGDPHPARGPLRAGRQPDGRPTAGRAPWTAGDRSAHWWTSAQPPAPPPSPGWSTRPSRTQFDTWSPATGRVRSRTPWNRRARATKSHRPRGRPRGHPPTKPMTKTAVPNRRRRTSPPNPASPGWTASGRRWRVTRSSPSPTATSTCLPPRAGIRRCTAVPGAPPAPTCSPGA